MLHIRQLFSDANELAGYCERNPEFAASMGLESALELWEFNPEIPLSVN
jgi:hypothetical protein